MANNNNTQGNSSSSSSSGGGGGGSNGLTGHIISMQLPNNNPMPVGDFFMCRPKPWCEHIQTNVEPIPQAGIDTRGACSDCSNEGENWICLKCYRIYCSRYVREHMVQHSEVSGHVMCLSFADLSVWCYGCSSYIDNEAFAAAISSAYRNKFPEEQPGPSSNANNNITPQ